ncbi:MAG TPA: hypothetical protein VGO57_10230 [Verrucomicrobiae bacterium]
MVSAMVLPSIASGEFMRAITLKKSLYRNLPVTLRSHNEAHENRRYTAFLPIDNFWVVRPGLQLFASV